VKAVPADSVPSVFHTLYNQAWFVGFALAFALYLLFRKLSNR
jgi:cytosine/uracil/thiamine/allantoin permease